MSPAELLDFSPPYLFPDYKSTVRRAPEKRLIQVPHEWFHRVSGPAFGRIPIGPNDNDLTNQHEGRPMGQRIVVAGRVLDSNGRGIPDTLVEVWQTNASGVYLDKADARFYPVDPNFTGAGRTLTDSLGRYSFRTVRPAPYAGAVGSAWRPAHIHVSLFGPILGTRLVTQCYFEGDRLIDHDPIVQSIPDPRGIERLIARMNLDKIEPGGPEAAIHYDWDIVVRGPVATPMET